METIFADAVNVTPNVYNYTKMFAVGRSSKTRKFSSSKFAAIQYYSYHLYSVTLLISIHIN